MAIWVDAETRVLVQGITGREGSFHTAQCREYGTQIVAGVTPGKGGTTHEGIPVYDGVAQAVAQEGANASMIFVPAPFAADAVMEAADAGDRAGRLHHGGHTDPRYAQGHPVHERGQNPADWTELPRNHFTW